MRAKTANVSCSMRQWKLGRKSTRIHSVGGLAVWWGHINFNFINIIRKQWAQSICYLVNNIYYLSTSPTTTSAKQSSVRADHDVRARTSGICVRGRRNAKQFFILAEHITPLNVIYRITFDALWSDQCDIALAAHINCPTCGDIIFVSATSNRVKQALNQAKQSKNKIAFAREHRRRRRRQFARCSAHSKNISKSFVRLVPNHEKNKTKLRAIAHLVCDNMRLLCAYANHSQSVSSPVSLARARTHSVRWNSPSLSVAAASSNELCIERNLFVTFYASVSLALCVRGSFLRRPFVSGRKSLINIMWWHFYSNWYFIGADTIFYGRMEVVRRYCNSMSRAIQKLTQKNPKNLLKCLFPH